MATLAGGAGAPDTAKPQGRGEEIAYRDGSAMTFVSTCLWHFLQRHIRLDKSFAFTKSPLNFERGTM